MKHIKQFENFKMNEMMGGNYEMVGYEYDAIIDLLNNDEWLMIGSDSIRFEDGEVIINNFEIPKTKYGRTNAINGKTLVITPYSVEIFLKSPYIRKSIDSGSSVYKNLIPYLNKPWRTIQRKRKMIEGGQVDIYKPKNKIDKPFMGDTSKFKRYFD